MNLVSFALIGVFLLVGVIYMTWKRSIVSKLNNAMGNLDYEAVLQMCDQKSTQHAIGSLNCNLYRLKAAYNGRGIEECHTLLMDVLSKLEKKQDKKELLDIYFQLYVLSGKRELCDQLIPFIEEIDEDLYSTFCGWCYDVLLDEKTDYIVEMDQMIEDKKLTGIQLGVTAYLIARQYEINNDLENALSYYYTCIPCFHPDNMYVSYAKHKTNTIAEELGKETRV